MAQWTKDTGSTLNTSFLAAYTLDANGTDIKGGFNATVNGSPTFSAGKLTNAVDGGSANTTKWLTYGSNIGQGAGAFSISCWVNVTTAPTSGNLMCPVNIYDATTGVGYIFYYKNNVGTLQTLFQRDKSGVSNTTIAAANTLTLGTWYHLVLRYDGVTLEGFLNGVSQGTSPASGNGNASLNQLNILSSDHNGSNFWSGLVDEAYFWNKKLSDTEVSDLYNSGTGSFYISAYVLTAAQGSFTLTGENVLFPINHTVTASTGTYTVTGESATFTPFYKWTNGVKSSGAFSNASKSSAPAWANATKDTSTFTTQPKS